MERCRTMDCAARWTTAELPITMPPKHVYTTSLHLDRADQAARNYTQNRLKYVKTVVFGSLLCRLIAKINRRDVKRWCIFRRALCCVEAHL